MQSIHWQYVSTKIFPEWWRFFGGKTVLIFYFKNADGASLIQRILKDSWNLPFFCFKGWNLLHFIFTYRSCLCLDVITKNWFTLWHRNDMWRERSWPAETNVSEKNTWHKHFTLLTHTFLLEQAWVSLPS